MDVREKLVELLKTNACPAPFMCDPACRYYGYGDCFPDRFADHLISHGVTVQEWISCEDRLPTQEDAPTEYVFTAYKNENCYDVNISLWDIVVGYPDLYDYWMPLPMPQPPKGE